METSKNEGDDSFPIRFGQFLKAFGLNTNRLAGELGDSNPVKFRRWLSGEVHPGYEHMRQISSQYGISLDWLILGEGLMLRQQVATVPAKFGNEDTDWKARFDALEIKHDELQQRYYKLTSAILREKMGLELD